MATPGHWGWPRTTPCHLDGHPQKVQGPPLAVGGAPPRARFVFVLFFFFFIFKKISLFIYFFNKFIFFYSNKHVSLSYWFDVVQTANVAFNRICQKF
jgi:hypothetical protein